MNARCSAQLAAVASRVASDLSLFLPERPSELVAFRWSTYDVPFWARPNTREGRWNLLGDEPTQYWSLSPAAAWAELIRHENLVDEADLDLVRMPLWVCRVPGAGLIDLRPPAQCEEHGVIPEQLIADDWRSCQRLSEVLRDRAPGVITPCAALPSEAN